ncbi:hypothetical protein Cri9333_0094 [Crinalium epipsammum PCC 9333]|uniref:Uncharacterized protein n=1 Tax=Crinalium epipsammum PCC 9333 TaxID=1173022 RepID=K9VU70_9CYAN|nr:hypothetical protein [Crinalium epipsammum]AFZ11094.1 hypothetical protein Cri9333_0094 [Crinalium epipsammum PCC 9333]
MSPDINTASTTASPILELRTISNNEGLAAFNALFKNNQQAADTAAAQLKTHWNKWATAFDAQWFQATEINAQILIGKKLAQELENAKIKVAVVIKKALDGQQINSPVTPPQNPVSNEDAVVAFYSIFKSQQIADKEVAKLVTNWNKWASAFGGQWLAPAPENAKILAGRIIAKAIADKKTQVNNAIQQAIVGQQINSFSDTPTNDNSTPSNGNNSLEKLELAKDRTRVYKLFMKNALNLGAANGKLVFLYQGVQKSPYKQHIKQYPERLTEKPDGANVISSGETIVLKGSNKTVTFTPYPKIGQIPSIDKSLDFLHPDIKEACICIGSFVDGQIKTHWLGRNALNKGQFWSATKILPILNILSKINSKFPDSDIDNCLIKDQNKRKKNYPVYDLAVDVVSYGDAVATSNSVAAMFKRFETRPGLELWVQKITGNNNLEFRGGYGEPAFIDNPQIFDAKKGKVLLNAAAPTSAGNNLVTAYDLTRFISMLGWHPHLAPALRLPGAQWHSLESIIRAMGTDAARYTDLAIKVLGIDSLISSPVIISKLGNGYSDSNKRHEIVYIAFVQFIDQIPKLQGQPAKLRTLSIALRGASNNLAQLDSRMATEVAEIMRRLVTEELA